jgi:hypothetical protein
MLRHHETAVFFRLHDRQAHPAEALHEGPIGKVASGALRTALDDVPGDNARGHAIPIGGRPAEFEHHGREGHRRVGHASGDDHVGAAFERLHDSSGAQIRVRREHPRANLGERLTGVHIRERLPRCEQAIDVCVQIVARDDGHLHLVGHVQVACERFDRGPATVRIDTTGVGDDRDATLRA